MNAWLWAFLIVALMLMLFGALDIQNLSGGPFWVRVVATAALWFLIWAAIWVRPAKKESTGPQQSAHGANSPITQIAQGPGSTYIAPQTKPGSDNKPAQSFHQNVSSGGIGQQGNITNNFLGKAQRSLSPEQVSRLVGIISTRPGQINSVMAVMGDDEGRIFADQLSDVFSRSDSNWRVGGRGTGIWRVSGLKICASANAGDQEMAKFLISAFREIGVEASTWGAPRGIDIIVGSK